MATAELVIQVEVPEPPTDLIDEDGENLESDWRRLAMNLLIELVGLHLKGREDYFVGGNMFIYFSEEHVRNRDFRGPDFFFVGEAKLNPPRRWWAVWNEGGKYPDVIIELTSPSTEEFDHGIKKDTYERVFRTSEYFIYDPGPRKLHGWRLNSLGRYEELKPNENGWLWCNKLGLWLGEWAGQFQGKQEVYLRYFQKDGSLIPSADERIDLEHRVAEAEKQRADAEKQRADAAVAELAKLRGETKPS